MTENLVIRSIRLVFFTTETAYDMLNSDWSSDVCSSNLQMVNPSITSIKISYQSVKVNNLKSCPLGVIIDRVEDLFNRVIMFDINVRSEEHTSELQSLMRISYAVFCLKKKNIKDNY